MNITVAEFVRLSRQFADRFERLAPDADGKIHPDDKRILRTFRKHLNRVAECKLIKVEGAQ